MRFSRRRLLLVCSSLFMGLLALPSWAAVFMVDRTDDSADAGAQICDDAIPNDCSLRGAVIKANTTTEEDELILEAETYTISIDRVTEMQNQGSQVEEEGDLDVTEALIMTGAGADVTTIQGAFTDDPTKEANIITANTNGSLTVSGVTITGGRGGDGGAIRAFTVPLSILDSHITGNKAANQGGGVSADGADNVIILISNSTFSDNQAGGDRGGGLFFETGDAFIVNSTFSGNTVTAAGGTADEGGGGIDASTGSMTMINSTVVKNTVSTAGSIGGGIRIAIADPGDSFSIKNSILADNDVSGASGNCGFKAGSNPVNSEGHNLSDDTSCTTDVLNEVTDQNNVTDPIVEAVITDNGGPTPTHLLVENSPAIDGVPNSDCTDQDDADLVTDQRDFKRPADGDDDGIALCDIGAVEIGCGNGNVETPEECDDGNLTDGDGCDSSCQIEGGGSGGSSGSGSGSTGSGSGGSTGGGTSGDSGGGGCSLIRELPI